MSKCEIDIVQVTSRGRSGGKENAEFADDAFDMPANEALEQLASGDVELSVRQARPPFALLEHAKGLLENADGIGPEFTAPKALEKAAVELFKDGNPAAMINGREVRWIFQSVEPELCKVLTDGVARGPNLFRQLDLVLSYRVGNAPCRSYEVAQSEREQETKGLLPLDLDHPGPVGRPTRFMYKVIGPDWHAFLTAMRELRTLRNQFLQTCLRQGRVLVVDDFNRNSGLISPTRWQREEFIAGKHVNYHFVLSSGLPRQWLNASKGARGKSARQEMAAAKDWLESEYARLGSDNKPKTKAQFVAEICRKFKTSKNAAERAWVEAEIPAWKGPGRPLRQT